MNHRKLEFNKLKRLKQKYPESFDYLEKSYNLDGNKARLCYSLNLYEQEHYGLIAELVNRYWLGRCTQLTLGCCVHDELLFTHFMQYWFPSQVKDLKIVYYQYMGEWSKIWNNVHFISNVGRITNEVRLCSLKLNARDITELFELFSHIKSIWFLNCELDIGHQTKISNVHYQIKMLSIIDCKFLDSEKYLKQSSVLNFLSKISSSELKSLRFLNLRGEKFDAKNFKYDSINSSKLIFLLEDNDANYGYKLRNQQYSYWLSKFTNIEKDDQFYKDDK